MVQEVIMVESIGPGGREMIPVVSTQDDPAPVEEPKKTRKKKTSE